MLDFGWLLGEGNAPRAWKIFPRNDDDGAMEETSFRADHHYLEIRLMECFLSRRRHLWTEFEPALIGSAEFTHSEQRLKAPFLLGKDTLGGERMNPALDAAEQRNMLIVGPVPFVGGDVSIRIALFRLASRNYAQELLGAAAELAKLAGLAMPVPTKAMEGLEQRISALLGMQDMDKRLAAGITLDPAPGADRALQDSYLAVMDHPVDAEFLRSLRIHDGLLVAGPDARPYTEEDFFLLRIARHTRRTDYQQLPFHQLWQRARTALVKGAYRSADAAVTLLYEDVADSADLTERQRRELLLQYMGSYEETRAFYCRDAVPAPSQRGTRSGHGGLSTARNALDRAAQEMGRQRVSSQTVDLVAELAEHWQEISSLSAAGDGKPADLTDELLRDQAERLERQAGQLGHLADNDNPAASEIARAFSREMLDRH